MVLRHGTVPDEAVHDDSDSLIDSAKIDGAGEFSIFWRIVMPNVKPAWLTLAIFQFQYMWGNTGRHSCVTETQAPAVCPAADWLGRSGKSQCRRGCHICYCRSANNILPDCSEQYYGDYDYFRYEGMRGVIHMRMSKRCSRAIIIILAVVGMLGNCGVALANDLPYDTYNYNFYEYIVYTPAAYVPAGSISGTRLVYNSEPGAPKTHRTYARHLTARVE